MSTIGSTTELPDRSFTSLDATRIDLDVLGRMLERLRRHLGELPESDPGSGRDDLISEPSDGGVHRIVVNDIDTARRPGDVIVVGFFGQARAAVDHQPIIDLESALIADMAAERSPLVYYNVHWPSAGWGNLVIFADQSAKDGWGRDPRHADAIARSPAHYHSIRLHVGRLPGGIIGGGAIELRLTRYFDFSGAVAWKAVRPAG
jgi:hypothetical protein